MPAVFQAVDLAQNQPMVLYSSSSNEEATINIRFVNRTSSVITVRLAIVNSPPSTAISDVTNADYVEYNTDIDANNILENTGLVVPASYSVVVSSTASGINTVAYGYSQTV